MKTKFRKQAQIEMPIVPTIVHLDLYRHDIVKALEDGTNIGIELGVAKGIFSERMLNSGKFKHFFGVDVYGDIHDINEYKYALRRLGLLSNYRLLRMTFSEALDLFEDEFFDFIYVDGFAHTGEEGGETLVQWYRKLKVGGIMAGDDYHDDWPLVKWAVNNFASEIQVELNVTGNRETVEYCEYPSWFFAKRCSAPEKISLSRKLKKVAESEKHRIYKNRIGKTAKLKGALRSALQSLGLLGVVKTLLRYD